MNYIKETLKLDVPNLFIGELYQISQILLYSDRIFGWQNTGASEQFYLPKIIQGLYLGSYSHPHDLKYHVCKILYKKSILVIFGGLNSRPELSFVKIQL